MIPRHPVQNVLYLRDSGTKKHLIGSEQLTRRSQDGACDTKSGQEIGLYVCEMTFRSVLLLCVRLEVSQKDKISGFVYIVDDVLRFSRVLKWRAFVLAWPSDAYT